ncbi:MAG: response regulator [Anaerolineae bacterium]|nr:response regulator [Anaerolineae bacterium]
MTQRKSTRIIIADDEAVIRMGLQTMVSSLGYLVVDTAANGYDALAKTRRLKPDLLLLDIKMPGKDGIAVAETLAEEMPLPIVMLTAYTERSLIQRAVNASVMGYLVKPITEIKLGPTIEIALQRFANMSVTAKQAYKLRDQLEARDLVDAAKKILIETGLTESEAYQRLQMAAREKRRSMRQVAEAVIAVGERLVA